MKMGIGFLMILFLALLSDSLMELVGPLSFMGIGIIVITIAGYLILSDPRSQY